MDNVAIYINKKNTQLAVSDGEKFEIIDMSCGYGKKSMPSCVHYNFYENEFLFFESALNNDEFEDTFIFNSIFDIIYSKEEYVEVENNKIAVKEILKNFFESLLEYYYNVYPNYKIKKLTICYDFAENINNMFIEVLNTLIDGCEFLFISEKEAIYSDVILRQGLYLDKLNFLSINSDKTVIYSLNKQSKNFFQESVEENYSFTIDKFEKSILEMMTDFYKTKNENFDNQSKLHLKKILNDNIDLILSKFIEEEDIKLYYNFCFPPLEQIIRFEETKKIFSELFNKLKFEYDDVFLFNEAFESDFFMKTLFKNKDAKTVNILFGCLYKSLNLDEKVDIRSIEKVDFEYGFFVNSNNKKEFVSILNQHDTDMFATKYFYFLKKYGENLTLYRKVDDDFIEQYNISCENLNIRDEISLLKMNISYIENKYIVKIENNGFLDSDNYGEITFEINEV